MGIQPVVFCLGTSVNVRAKSTLSYHHHFSTLFYLHLHDHQTSGWRRLSPDRTTTPRARRASTSKSTWSSTPATSITPWPSTLTGRVHLPEGESGRVAAASLHRDHPPTTLTGIPRLLYIYTYIKAKDFIIKVSLVCELWLECC